MELLVMSIEARIQDALFRRKKCVSTAPRLNKEGETLIFSRLNW